MTTQRPRKNGTMAFYVTVDYPSSGGRRRRRSGTFDSKAEARSAERLWQREASAGGAVPGRELLGDYLRSWLAAKEHTVADTTHASYAEYITTLIAPRLGQLRLDHLTSQAVQQMLSELRSRGRADGKGGLSSSRVNGARRVLCMSLADAVEDGILGRNPMDRVRPVRHEVKEYPEWSEEHLQRFLDAAVASKLGAYWVLALITGMRRGELLGLRWADVIWDTGQLQLRRQIKALKGKAKEGTLKSRRGRVVQLGAGGLAVLAAHQTAQRAHKVKVRLDWMEHDLVFCADDGRAINPTTITHLFSRLAAEAGVPRIKPHLLRAINASVSVAEGADPRTLADRLGHSRPSTTQDHYLRRTAGKQRDLADAVEEAILRRAK